MKPSFVQTDQRLRVSLARPFGELTIPGMCTRLREATGVQFRVDDPELVETRFLAGVPNGQTAFDFMDAIASIGDYRWEHLGKQGYRMLPSARQFKIFSRANDQRRQQINESMLDFADAMNGVTPQLRNEFQAGERIQMDRLPTSMLKPVKSALLLRLEISGSSEARALMSSVSNAPASRFSVRFKKDNNIKGIEKYNVEIGGPGVGMSFSVTDFDRKFDANGNPKTGVSSDGKIFNPGGVAKIKKSDQKKFPDMQKIIALNIVNGNISKCIESLFYQKVPIVTIDKRSLRQKITLSINNAPLWAVLDRLVSLSKDPEIEWERRDSGFIVLRRTDFGLVSGSSRGEPQ